LFSIRSRLAPQGHISSPVLQPDLTTGAEAGASTANLQPVCSILARVRAVFFDVLFVDLELV